MPNGSNGWLPVKVNVPSECLLAGCAGVLSGSALAVEGFLADDRPNPFEVLVESLRCAKKAHLIDSGLDRLSSLLIVALLDDSDRGKYLNDLSRSDHKEDKQFKSVFTQILRLVDLRAGPLLVERYLQGYINYLQSVIAKAADVKKPTYTTFLAAVSEFKKAVCDAWQDNDAPWLLVEKWAAACDRSACKPLWFFDRLASESGDYFHPVATEDSGPRDKLTLTVG